MPVDEPAVARAFRVVLHHGLLEQHGVAPVPEVDPRVRPGVHRLAENDEALEPGPRKPPSAPGLGRERSTLQRDERGRDLAAEESRRCARSPSRWREASAPGPGARTRVRPEEASGAAVAGIGDRADEPQLAFGGAGRPPRRQTPSAPGTRTDDAERGRGRPRRRRRSGGHERATTGGARAPQRAAARRATATCGG